MTNNQLPPTPSLEFDKKQAKSLLKAYQNRDSNTLDRIQKLHPRLRNKSHEEILATDFKLADAQWIIALEYGFSSWTTLKRHIQSLSTDFKDKLAVFKDAVQEGDAEKVRQLLSENEDLLLVIDEPNFSFDSPALVLASSYGHQGVVEVLLDFGADINKKSDWWAGGFSALYHANPEITQLLIKRGAKIDIHAACKLDMLDQVKAFVEADPESVYAKGGDGQRPLHYAKSKPIIDYLLENGAEINARDVDHNGTAAQWAINDYEKCRYLVEKGADVDIFMAIALGDVGLVKQVLADNPDAVNARIGDQNFGDNGSEGGHIYVYELGYTVQPLKLATRKGNQAIIDILLENASNKQRFLLACMQADGQLAREILADNPSIVSNLPTDDQLIITDAAWERNIAAVRLMLELGFDVDTPGVHHSTPIDRAALRGYADVVQLCLEYGASLTIKNEFGGTPLGAALWGSQHFCDPTSDYSATVEALLKAGSPINPDWLPTGNAEIDTIIRRYQDTQKD